MKFSLWTFFIILPLTFVIVQCNHASKSFSISLGDAIELQDIPSGSGMVFTNDIIYIISDDSPHLFQLSREYQIIEKVRITEGFKDISRIEKPLKPDYECLAMYQSPQETFLYGFGSGSLAEKRDSLVIIDLENSKIVKTYSLSPFYDKLSSIAGGKNRENLNIEGAAIDEENLYLLNRGTNSVFVVNMESFNDYLNEENSLSDLQIQFFKVVLPGKEGGYVGLSGCTIIPGTRTMIFTATVEATANWIADGEILGSFVGVISLNELQKKEPPLLWQFEKDGQPLLDKIESITITKSENKDEYAALAIADNDDGSSKIYPLKITFK